MGCSIKKLTHYRRTMSSIALSIGALDVPQDYLETRYVREVPLKSYSGRKVVQSTDLQVAPRV